MLSLIPTTITLDKHNLSNAGCYEGGGCGLKSLKMCTCDGLV